VSRSLLLFSLLALTACGPITQEVEVPLDGQPADIPPLAPAENYWKIRGHRQKDSTWEWVASTSVRVLRHPESGVRIRLFALTHIAPLAYFRSMESHLRSADLVLYEGVIGRAKDLRSESELDWVGRSQDAERRFMTYSSQSEWVDRLQDRRWINVDCSIKAATAGMERDHIELVSEERKKKVLAMEHFNEHGGTPDEASRIRSEFGALILWAFLEEDEAPGTGTRKIQDRRNFAIFSWLRRRLASGQERDIALLYGAAHAQALEPYLVRDLGFRFESATWHDVNRFTIDARTSGEAALRGRLRMNEGDDEGAASDLNRALDLDPASANAHYQRFQLYEKQQRHEEALLEIDKVLALLPDDPVAMAARASTLFRLNRFQDSIRMLDQLLAKAPSAVTYKDRSANWYRMGDLPHALADLERAVELDPGNPQYLQYRGGIHHELHHLTEAQADYEKVLARIPAHADTLGRITAIRDERKDFDGIIADATRAIDADSGQAQFYHYRGYGRYQKGEFALATADYEKAVSLAPTETSYLGMLGQSAHALGEFEKARNTYTRLLKLDPENFQFQVRLANVSYDERRWDEALELYRRDCERWPDAQESPQGRIWMLRTQQGKKDEATKDLRRFLAADTDTSWEWSLLAYLAGELPEGQVVKIMEKGASNPELLCTARFYLGTKHLIAGDKAGAKAIFLQNRDHRVCGSESHASVLAELRRLEKD
jgi:tetratricopeptide (TPR) repeat protein